MDLYPIYTNNGALIALCTNKAVTKAVADDHYKDVAEWPMDYEDMADGSIPIYDGDWNQIGFLHDFQCHLTISEAAQEYSLAYSTLAQAVREGRVVAQQHGKIWLTTKAAIEEAIEAGRLKPR